MHNKIYIQYQKGEKLKYSYWINGQPLIFKINNY